MADFDVQVRLRSVAGATMLDLHDHAAGLCLRDGVELADEVWARDEETSRYLDGHAETHATLESGRLLVRVRIEGGSWPQVEQRRLAIRLAYINAPSFLLDWSAEGVTQTFRANRPDVANLGTSSVDLMNKVRTIQLSFPVQPNPTIAGV